MLPRIPWSFHRGHHLKVRFRELGLDHQVSESHVDFGSVRSAVAEGDSRPESKLRRQPARHSQHGTQVANRYAAPAAKYIHEQRIRTVRAIELLPSPARAGRCSARTGMDLRKPARPFRIGGTALCEPG
jgi:hypothetical protein